MSDCEYIRLADAYYDAELSTEERRRFETHLATCDACAYELQELERVSRLMVNAPIPGMPPDVLRRLHQSAATVRERVVVTLAKKLTAAAAAAIIVGCAGLWAIGLAEREDPLAMPASWELAAVRLDAETDGSDAQQMTAWVVTDLSLENGHD